MTQQPWPYGIINNEVINPLRAVMLSSAQNLSTGTVENFALGIIREFKLAISRLCDQMAVASMIELEKSYQAFFIFSAVSAINGALGRECPYLAIIVIFREKKEVVIATLSREEILEQFLELESDDIVLVLEFENKEDMSSSDTRPLRIVSSPKEFEELCS